MIGSPLDIEPKRDGHGELLARATERIREIRKPELVDGPEHVLVGQRQSGKTFHAMRWLLEDRETTAPLPRRVLVVMTTALADHMRRQYDMKPSDDRVISWRQLRNRGPERDAEYGFDAADQILATMLGLSSPMRLMTVTTDV